MAASATTPAQAIEALNDFSKNSQPEELRSLCELMDAHSARADVQEAACQAVARLCSNNFRDRDDEIRSAAVVFGAFKRVVDAAKLHPTVASLQAAALLALARGCINDDARASVFYVGGLSVAISAMTAHASDLQVLANACQAIGRMGEDFNEEDYLGDMVDVELDRAEHPHGLLFNTRMYRGRLRIDKFRKGPNGEDGELERAGVVHIGDSVIKIGNQPTYDLSHHEVAALLSEKVIRLRIRCFPTDLFADRAEELIRQRLAELTAKKDARRKTIGEQGGVAVVINAMRANPAAAAVQQWGLFALAKVANQNENLRMVANMNGVELAVSTLRRHEDHAGVQEWGFEALSVLTFDDYSRLQVQSNGGVPVIVAGTARHSAISNVQRSGFKALATACAGSVVSRRDALQAGVIQAAASAIKMHLSNEHVVDEVLHAMRALIDGGGTAAPDDESASLGKEMAKQKGAQDFEKALGEVHKLYMDVDTIEANQAALHAHLSKHCVVM